VADRFALWVYGVVDGEPPGPPPCVGVDGHHRVELVRADGLAALASRVPRPRFDAHVLCRALQQPRTFEALVRTHQDVLREALALGAVLPFGFATVFKSEAAVRALLRRRAPSDGSRSTPPISSPMPMRRSSPRSSGRSRASTTATGSRSSSAVRGRPSTSARRVPGEIIPM
jgi:hypothetical protein